jgi:hypothetical protein
MAFHIILGCHFDQALLSLYFNPGNRSTIDITQDLAKVAGIRALAFRAELALGGFLALNVYLSRFINGSTAQEFET